jgi:Short C-terminal domain
VFSARRIVRRRATARRADASRPEQVPEAYDEAPPPDPAEQLKELAELREQGILTEEEFAAEKRRLLGA